MARLGVVGLLSLLFAPGVASGQGFGHVSDKARPVAIAKASYSTRTLVCDVADLDDPILAQEHISPNRATDHNPYIVGNRMFQSNYVSGLRVLDITHPEQPVEVGYSDTVPVGENEPGFGGSWSNYPYFKSGNVVVTSMEEGLFVLRPRPRTVIP